MAYKSRLKRIEEDLESKIYVVEENGKKVSDSRNPNLPLYNINKKLQSLSENNDIAPVKTKTNKKNKSFIDDVGYIAKSLGTGVVGGLTGIVKSGTTEIQNNLNKSKNEGLLKNVGDLFNASQYILNPTKAIQDAVVKNLKNAYNIAKDKNKNPLQKTTDYALDSLTNVTNALIPGKKAADETVQIYGNLIGSNRAEKTVKNFDETISKPYNTLSKSLSEESNQYGGGTKLAGDVANVIGYMAPSIATTLLTKNPNVGLAVMGVSSKGSSTQEALNKGADLEQAIKIGNAKGMIEVGTEMLTGGINIFGKGALDNIVEKGIDKAVKKNVLNYLGKKGVGVGGEVVEETISDVLGTVIDKGTVDPNASYTLDDWEDTALTTVLSTVVLNALTGGYGKRSYMENSSQLEQQANEKKVVDSLVNEKANEISKQRATEKAINEAISTKEAEQGGTLSTKEKTAIKQQIEAKIDNGEIELSSNELSNKEISTIKAEVEEQMNKGLLDTNKINNILGENKVSKNSILAKSYEETAKKSQNFTYDTNKITDEKEKAVYDSATKYFNNTTRSHEFVEKVAKISKEKGTNYGFINNEELQSLGHDVEDKQVNGLVRTTQDGKQTVLINVDSPKALNTIVGHETTHLLEGTQEYKDLQEAIFNYAKEKGDFDSRQKALNSLYEGIDNANVDSELTADLVGDYLFTDEKFIDSLSTQKPTVFQKIKNLIDDLVVKFTGTKEEKALREVQKKFKEAYKQNVASKETSTKYSVSDNKIQGLENYSKDEIKSISNDYIKQKLEENDLYDVEIKGIDIHGSRNRGTARNDSDLDVVVEFDGDVREDTLFDILNEEHLEIDGIQVDINPITANDTGTLQDYMERSNEYDKEVLAKGTKYSVSNTDNQGRTLTKEQQEFFKDVSPEVKDENGNLKVLYHGSNATDTTVFTKDKFGDRGVTFLTDDPDIADTYRNNEGKRYELYADIKNPLVIDAKGSYWSNIDYYGDGSLLTTTDEIVKDALNGGELDSNGKFVPYDGVVFKNVIDRGRHFHKAIGNRASNIYVAFNSNQIKSIDNTNPTSDADIRYSLSEKGTLQDSNGNDVTLETSETGTHGTLMAVHNLSESKLKGILELGGFPVPSIAIMNPSTTNLEYGDISVLFDKSTIDPSNKANEVYGSDVYSPRFPQTVQKINEKELSKLENYLGKNLYLEDTTLDETVQKNRYTKEFIDKFAKENNITADNVYKDSGFNYTFSTDENVKNFVTENNVTFEKLLNDEQLRNKFYELYRQSTPETLKGFTERKIEIFEKAFDDKDVNIGSRLDSDFNSIKNGSEKVLDEYATEKALRDKVLNQYEEQYAKFLTEKLTPVFEDKYIRNSKELFTPSGNRRSFNQLYNEYTLDNVVKEMKGKVRGEEGFFYGAGNIRSQVTPQFKSIADIKANEGKLITNSEMETVKQDIDSELNNLSVTAKNFGGYTYDSYETALNEIAGLKKITSDKAKSILNEYGFKNVPDILVDKSIEFLEKLKNAPTEYFEAKPQRAVGLDEVQAIVVPNRINNELKQQLLDKGLNVVEYDPNIEGDKQSKINQFDDLKFSLSQQGEQIAPTGNYNVYGEDVKYQEAIAPLQEEIKTLTETVNELKEQIAPVKTTNEEYKANTESDLPVIEQQNIESFNNIDESNMPMEAEDYIPDGNLSEPKSLFETRDYEDVGSRKVNAYQYDHPEVKPYYQTEAQSMLNDLKNSIKGERFYNDDLYYSSGGEQGYYGTQRQTTNDIAELLDGMDGKYKYTYADIEKGLNAIIKDEGAENNAVSKRIELYLDQRLRKGYTTVDGIEVPANQDYIDTMKAIEINDYYNNIPIDDSMIPAENISNSEEIAPIRKQKTEINTQYETIRPEPVKDTHGYTLKRVKSEPTNEEIAKVLDEEPKTENQRNKRKWAILKANVFDKGAVFEDVSLKNKNRELMGKWDYTLTSEARGQNAIGQGHYEYDPISKSTKQVSKSLNDIRAEVENTGLTKDFYDYMYHKHNIDRMNLQQRFGEENKPVFGNTVTSEQSQSIVNKYENTHPEFMDYAQDVYDYLSADRQQLVKEGVISQETADLWQDMYPHYVPIRRVDSKGLNIDVPLDTGRTSVNAPIKRATGGNTDILPLFDTMAQRTLQTYRATAKNSFGVELMNTLGTRIENQATNIDDVIDSIDNQEGLLQEGKNGRKPTFTVFENGEKVTFEITEDMYDALKPLSDSSLLSKTFLPFNKVSNFHRGLLTEYNPVFMLTNAIKDSQDVLINSQHATRTYAKVPEAFKQLVSKGYWYQEYIANGGEQNSYFDSQENTFKTENKGLKKILDLPPLSTISKLNNFIEMTPRLAEYIASRESGRSVEVSMLDAARVTTNFKAGGNLTKFANRNGATFLNASVQGAMQQVRNVREAKANGIRGWMNLATKFAVAGVPAYVLNALLWSDDDDYENLSNYVKQNYYIVWKDDNGNFIRIPKGRTLAVIQEGIQQMSNAITGDDEVDLKSFIDLALNNLAPNNPIENNVFSPITQVATNKAWYGGDLVPKRLQDLPASEQYDESTDSFSKWLGEVLNVSPYKVNYLLDQYSGGVGDIVLPMMTPEAKNDADTLGEQLLAPLKNKFTANSTMNNQNVSDFYELKEKLTTQAKKSDATDEDVLKNKYLNSVNAELSDLYEKKREIQNSNLSNSEKYNQAKEIQSQINSITENAINEYQNVNTSSNYAQVGNKEYYKRINSEGKTEWTSIRSEEAEELNSLGLSRAEKNTYFIAKNEISSIVSDYKDNKSKLSNLDEDSDEYKEAVSQLSSEKKADIISKIKNTGLNDEQKAYLYKKYYNSKTIDAIVSSGISVDAYLDYDAVEFESDKDNQGNSIPYSRKNKVISYVNSLDLSIPQKAILIKSTNTFNFNNYNNQIIEYIDGLDISYEDKVDLLKDLDMEVLDDGTIRWK